MLKIVVVSSLENDVLDRRTAAAYGLVFEQLECVRELR